MYTKFLYGFDAYIPPIDATSRRACLHVFVVTPAIVVESNTNARLFPPIIVLVVS